MSFPLGTEIFQFPRFCFSNLWIQLEILSKRKWVPPFGNPRIKAYWQLPEAYRSLLRPSSPLYAKASIKCPYFAYFPNLCAELNLLSWILLKIQDLTWDIWIFAFIKIWFFRPQILKNAVFSNYQLFTILISNLLKN